VATLGQDLRYAIRRMKRTPGFTAVAIATLALGLGINSAVWSLANALFLKPLPLDDPGRLVQVDQSLAWRPGQPGFSLSYPDYLHYRDHARTFADLAAHYPTSPMHVASGDGGFDLTGSVVTANYFSVLRLRPVLGRFFSADEDQVPDRNPVAVLSHDLWRSRFAADEQILDTVVRINGTSFTVVGVAPEGFRGIVRGVTPTDVWIPTAMFRAGYRYCDGLSRGCNVINLIGRLNGSASVQDAQAEMTVLARQLEAEFPDTNKGRGAVVSPARGVRAEEQVQNAPIVALLAGAAALVLLIASANVAGLLLARGLRRRKDVAIELALGASRGRLIRQLLVESVALSIAGGAAGLIVAIWSTEVLRGFFGVNYNGAPNNLDLGLDLRLVAVGFAASLATGLVTGIAPALQSTRPDTLPTLKDETGGASARRSTFREALIVGQVAVSVLLLAASGLLVRSFFTLQRGPGFDPDAVVLLRLRPSLLAYTPERAWAFQREVIRRLEALPGVIAASPASVPPLPRWFGATVPVQPGAATADPARAFQTSSTYVGPRYFKALGGAVVEGREFDDRDTPDGPPATIVNETLARHFWPQGGALGSTLTIGNRRCEVVGVVKDLQYVSVLEVPKPIAYLAFWQQDRADNWSQDSRTHVRVSGNAATLLPEMRRAIAAIDPDVPVTDAGPLGARLDYEFSDVRAARTLLVTFGALALVLSTIGLYAALAFAVGQRTREIAIRIALGAARGDVGWLVVRRGAALVVFGAIAGLGATAVAGPLIANLLYGVSPRDPLALLAGPSILGLVALLAMWLPARRAMAMDPVVALRAD
jgi:putative ABC transport system permease protein